MAPQQPTSLVASSSAAGGSERLSRASRGWGARYRSGGECWRALSATSGEGEEDGGGGATVEVSSEEKQEVAKEKPKKKRAAVSVHACLLHIASSIIVSCHTCVADKLAELWLVDATGSYYLAIQHCTRMMLRFTTCGDLADMDEFACGLVVSTCAVYCALLFGVTIND